MTALETLLFAYVLNAARQLPLLAGLGWVLRRILRPSPRLEYALWLLIASLAFLLPLSTGLGLWEPALLSEASSVTVPDSAQWGRLVLVVWLLPSLWHTVRLLRNLLATHRLRAQGATLFAHHGVAVRESPQVLGSAGPLLVGLFRPVVFIPRFLIDPARRDLLDAALAHELAHVRRHDMATSLLSHLLLLPLRCHPVSAWLLNELDSSRELACDAHCAVHPLDYARCLLDIARHCVEPRGPLTALGIADAQILERRIHALTFPVHRRPNASEFGVLAITLLLACAMLSGAARSTYHRIAHLPAPRLVRDTLTMPPAPPPPPPALRVRR